MKALYLDTFSGISGDMFLGAMLDLGVEIAHLQRALATLPLAGCKLVISREQRAHISGVRFAVQLPVGERDSCGGEAHGHGHNHEHGPDHKHDDVHGHHDHDHDHDHNHPPHHHHHHDGDAVADRRGSPPPASPPHAHASGARDFAQIEQMLLASGLSEWVKRKSVDVFRRVAVAEGKIHGMPPDRVHFHEVGAVDSIVDIVGACVALEALGKPRVLASAVVEGVGWIECAHGRFPIPAPATLEILSARGVPVSQCDEPQELVTPTGAALLAEFAESFGPLEGLRVERVGYGLGSRENRTRPNALRALIGELDESPEASVPSSADHDWETDTVAVLETNLDDVSAEVLGDFVERALRAGALDVFHTPIQMKKSRPGVLLTMLCDPAEAGRFAVMMLRETTAFGVRKTVAERRKLRREFRTVQTPYGEVIVKLGWLDGRLVQAAPEYESCRKAALLHGGAQSPVPVREVYQAALAAFRQQSGADGPATTCTRAAG